MAAMSGFACDGQKLEGGRAVKNTLRLLVLLGVAAQAIALSATWHELSSMLRGDAHMDSLGTALIFLPSLLGFGGAAAARSLHRRGSGWAWVMAGLPLVLLVLGLCLAAFLWVNPISHHQ
jgi:hypothetical protein